MTGPGTGRAAFEREGYVRVRGVVPRDAVEVMRAAMGATLAAHGVREERFVELAGALRPGPGTETVLWEVGRQAAFAPLPAALVRAADGVFGAGVWGPPEGQQGGLAAPNLPIPGVWSVPHQAWHVDEPTAPGQTRSWGLLGFVFLDEVEAGGGGTAMIAGSHRRLLALAAQLVAEGARPAAGWLLTTDEAMVALAAAEPWFADLFRPGDPAERQRRFVDEGHVSSGIPLRVVELTGSPGDIVLMDPRCLHTVAANVSRRARLTMRMVCGRRVAR